MKSKIHEGKKRSGEMSKESVNIWGINEYVGDGVSCPITPANLPVHKKIVLFFFRFGICPACVSMSLVYNVKKAFRKKVN